MAVGHLLWTAVASLVAAGAFAVLGFSLWQREYPAAVRRPGRAYALWWLMAATMALSDGLRVLQGADGMPSVGAYLLLVRLKIVVAGVAIASLGYYVVYLWTGRDRSLVLMGALGLSHAGFFLYLLQGSLPARVAVGKWSTRLVLEGPGALPVSLGAFGAVLFFLPPLLLAVAFLALWRRLPDASQRARVMAVSLAVAVTLLVSSIQFNATTSPDSDWFLVFTLLDVLTAVVALGAYHPPAWLRRRGGLRDLDRTGNATQM